MTATYLLNLVLMLALVAGMAVGALWLARKLQPGLGGGRKEGLVRVVDAVPLGTMGRLAVVEFGGRQLLVAVSRGRIELIAEAPLGSDFADYIGDDK
ncbi:MAG: flagellar biosynthetic protein FliO [Sphingomonadaceae bacterium]|nr:flagellar biosynthetic protein FliO [Sphingomonadaceae bacterium]